MKKVFLGLILLGIVVLLIGCNKQNQEISHITISGRNFFFYEEFDKDTYHYDILVPYSTDVLSFAAGSHGYGDNIIGLDTLKLIVGQNSRKIIMTKDDDSRIIYTFNIHRETKANSIKRVLVQSVDYCNEHNRCGDLQCFTEYNQHDLCPLWEVVFNLDNFNVSFVSTLNRTKYRAIFNLDSRVLTWIDENDNISKFDFEFNNWSCSSPSKDLCDEYELISYDIYNYLVTLLNSGEFYWE